MSKRLTDDKLQEFGNIKNVGDFAKNITLDSLQNPLYAKIPQ